MSKYDETRDAIEVLAELVEASEHSNSEVAVKIYSNVLRDAVEAIDVWKSIAEEFANSIVVTPGEKKTKNFGRHPEVSCRPVDV